MRTSVQVACLFSLLVAAVSEVSAANLPPEDHNPQCRTGFNTNAHIFPEEWELLIDTHDYMNIYDQSSSPPPVWAWSDVDGDNENWQQIVGGSCTWSLYTCTYTKAPQENWLFSQYISYQQANELFFNISYRFTQCRDRGSCEDDFVTLYRFDVDGPVGAAEQTNPSNYQLLNGTEQDSRLQQLPRPVRGVSQTRSMLRPEPRTGGFYLGVKDSGTCGQVNRIIIYYTVCHGRQNELVVYPQAAHPPRNGPDSIFQASCVANAHNITSLDVKAFSGNGTCRDVVEGGARCECDAGYQIAQDRKSCIECSAGTYRALGLSSTCQLCPANTMSDAAAASVCACLPDFFRTSEEGPEKECTEPPTAVLGLRSIDADSMSITLEWRRPLVTGRDDFYYQILVTELGKAEIVVDEMLVNGDSVVVHIVKGLRPFTNYSITVVTHNGVSGMDPDGAITRMVTIRAATTEGVPGMPLVNPLCTVVVWREPSSPAGIITGYELRFERSDDKVVNYSANSNFHITSDLQREQNVDVEMRAMNSIASSPWTAPMPLNCTTQVKCPTTPTTSVSCPQLEAPGNGSVASNDSDAQYSCNQGFALVGDATRSCQDSGSWTGMAPTCVSQCLLNKPYFMKTIFRLENGSQVSLQMIGEGDNALVAKTPYTNCCVPPFRMGEWYFPNGTRIGPPRDGQSFFRNRGNMVVRLNRRVTDVDDSIVYPTGWYRCELPDGCGDLTSIYIELV